MDNKQLGMVSEAEEENSEPIDQISPRGVFPGVILPPPILSKKRLSNSEDITKEKERKSAKYFLQNEKKVRKTASWWAKSKKWTESTRLEEEDEMTPKE